MFQLLMRRVSLTSGGNNVSQSVGRRAELRLLDQTAADRSADFCFGGGWRQNQSYTAGFHTGGDVALIASHRHDQKRQAVQECTAHRAVAAMGNDQRDLLHDRIMRSAGQQGYVRRRVQAVGLSGRVRALQPHPS